MNLIAGGCGGMRGLRRGESTSSIGCEGCGGVTGSLVAVPFIAIVGCLLLKLFVVSRERLGSGG